MPGKKLLVADDSLTIQKVIRLALSNEGYEIQAVSDGNDTIQQIALFRPDVILIDISLPGKSAFEVKREINTHPDLEEIRFVLMSSAFEKVDEEQVDEVQFHGRLTKPFDPAHLRQVLTDVLGQVTAKRMEKTSLLSRPSGESIPPPLPSHPTPSFMMNPPGFPEDEEEEEEEDQVRGYELNNEWNQQLEPDEMPILPPTPSEPVKDLWDSGPKISLDPPNLDLPPLPFPEPSPSSNEEEDSHDHDIKHLTESTMKGLEDFQWNVSEPSLKPLPKMFDRGNSNFESPVGSLLNPTIPSIPTMEDMLDPPKFYPPTPEFPESNFQLDMDPPSFSKSSMALPVQPPSPMISEAQIESMIRKQVETMVEKIARKLIPEVTEKIIKQEIHKLLSE